ncbi:MAG: Rieske (2Fe-2S) protein [Planctomycetes bacterium]|nr:Rieske (2Fe-2S) protein [Planctomycetota bacterium]
MRPPRTWTRAIELGEIEPDSGAILQLWGVPIAVFRVGDGAAAVGAVCPHAGSLLCEFLSDSGTAMCPSHGWEFSLRDGACTTHRTQRVPVYPARIEDGAIWVQVRPLLAWLSSWTGRTAPPARRLR